QRGTGAPQSLGYFLLGLRDRIAHAMPFEFGGTRRDLPREGRRQLLPMRRKICNVRIAADERLLVNPTEHDVFEDLLAERLRRGGRRQWAGVVDAEDGFEQRNLRRKGFA